MTEVIETSAILEISITYQYKKQNIKTLNSMGNFYRSSHLHKKTQKLMEEYIKEKCPKNWRRFTQQVIFLTVINVTHDYQRTGEKTGKESRR